MTNSQFISQLFSAPNILSLFRLFSAIFILYFIKHNNFVCAVTVLFLAAISDALDGFIARKFNSISVIGTYLDPIADKILINLTFIALCSNNFIPLWVATLVVMRDAAILIGCSVIMTICRKFECADVRPNIIGKVCAVIQLIFLIFIMITLEPLCKSCNTKIIVQIFLATILLLLYIYKNITKKHLAGQIQYLYLFIGMMFVVATISFFFNTSIDAYTNALMAIVVTITAFSFISYIRQFLSFFVSWRN